MNIICFVYKKCHIRGRHINKEKYSFIIQMKRLLNNSRDIYYHWIRGLCQLPRMQPSIKLSIIQKTIKYNSRDVLSALETWSASNLAMGKYPSGLD